jgi:hypothetical protein
MKKVRRLLVVGLLRICWETLRRSVAGNFIFVNSFLIFFHLILRRLIFLTPHRCAPCIPTSLCTILRLHRKGGGRMTSSDSNRCTQRPGEVAET